jgi:hypothetical protein
VSVAGRSVVKNWGAIWRIMALNRFSRVNVGSALPLFSGGYSQS